VVGEFVESDPASVWAFVRRWGISSDDDLRMAIATCVMEDLLEYHFDDIISRVEEAALADHRFGDMVSHSWKLSESEEPSRAARFDALVRSIPRKPPNIPNGADAAASPARRFSPRLMGSVRRPSL
jgi:hypothetical protein